MTAEPSPMTVRHETLTMRSVRTAQDESADAITRFAGSMAFVYLHVGWFPVWIVVNSGLLPGMVSLEAIFLSTFVMISQNREAARSDVRAQLDFETNLRAELLVRAIAERSGVDLAAIEQTVATRLARVRDELQHPPDS